MKNPSCALAFQRKLEGEGLEKRKKICDKITPEGFENFETESFLKEVGEKPKEEKYLDR